MGVREPPLEGLAMRSDAAPSAAAGAADAFRGRRVLVTGHNGFVGSWLSLWLAAGGADVTGISLPRAHPQTVVPDLRPFVHEQIGDVSDLATVVDLVRRARPEVVFHLAAQALVLRSYASPLETLQTNVVGTANLLEALRLIPCAAACVVATSDKCYAPSPDAHREDAPLGGDDPYSASKAACELLVQSWRASFFAGGPALSTVRAGNILGGGDWAEGRILPDCIRSLEHREPLRLRNPAGVRPWQHVLDAVAGYLALGDAMLRRAEDHAAAWNLGPPAGQVTTVGELVAMIDAGWRRRTGSGLVEVRPEAGASKPERGELLLDSSKARSELGWSSRLGLADSIEWSLDWYHAVLHEPGGDPTLATLDQISRYDPAAPARAAGAPSLVALA